MEPIKDKELDDLSVYVNSNFDNAIDKCLTIAKKLADKQQWLKLKEVATIGEDLSYYFRTEDWENASYAIEYILDEDFTKELDLVAG